MHDAPPNVACTNHQELGVRINRFHENLQSSSTYTCISALWVLQRVLLHTGNASLQDFQGGGDYTALHLSPADRPINRAVRENEHFRSRTARHRALRAYNRAENESLAGTPELLNACKNL